MSGLSIAEQVYTARKQAKLTQQELGAIISSSHLTISKLENGHFLPSVRLLTRISKALNTTFTIDGRTESV